MMEAMTDSMSQQPGPDPFDPQDVDWLPVSAALVTVRRILVTVWWLIPLAVALLVGALVASPWGWTGFGSVVVVWVWMMWLIPRQVRAWGYAQRADDLLIRRGLLRRTLVVVPYGRMQMVDVASGPLARRFGVATIQLHTASAGTDAQIPGLDATQAAVLRDRLAARGEARMAGL